MIRINWKILLVLASFLISRGGQCIPAPAALTPEELFKQAGELIDQGKNDQAITLLNQLARTAPQTPGLEAKLGKAYYQKRSYPEAILHLERALQEKPDDAESIQLLGLSDYLAGRHQDAIPLLEKVQAMLPRPDVTGSYILGVSYLDTFQYDKARGAFAKMFSVPPDSAGAYVVLAQMMIKQSFEEKAVPELQKALALDPKAPMAHFLLGEIYLLMGKAQLALDEFHQELEINPILWQAYWRMGDAYTRVGKWNQAEDALKQAAWLNKDFSGTFILLGKVELKKGDPQLAVGYLQRALKLDPNNFSAHYLLGSSYKELGRVPDADREFELSRTLHENE